MKIIGLVLAAGQGKRMKSKLYKMLHPVCGKPMLGHVMDRLEALQTDRRVVIVGHGAEAVQVYLGDRAEYVLQAEQLGTGHAVMQAEELLKDEEGTTIVICGDTPLIKEFSLQELIKLHTENKAAATIMTAELENPFGYGRVIRDKQGHVERIVEQKDCSADEAEVNEINAGTYCFDNRKLFNALNKVNNHNKQNEYFLTDVIAIMKKNNELVQGYCLGDYNEAIGINDRIALAEAERIMKEQIQHSHGLNGVTITDPSNTYIGVDVIIGSDTTIMPGTHLRGSTVIGSDCVIGPNADITNSKIGNGVQVKYSYIQEAIAEDDAVIGPYAHLRPGAHIGPDVKIGNFVEIKNATLGKGSKASHLSYIGDAKVGENVNIGCGAITVNYDGYNKHHTEIEDDAFIGSNVNLIAPIRIGRGAFVVAGSTLTHDVQENSLAIARERQTNKPGYAERLRNRIKRT